MRNVFLCALAALFITHAGPGLAGTNEGLQIPSSIEEEHAHIHEALGKAVAEKGVLGETARKLMNVLHPHFEREEEIALPPLALLQQVSEGKSVNDDTMAMVIKMTDSLEAEMPQMLEEHNKIREAVERFRIEAVKADQKEYVEFADKLALHAKQEEQILYPAAILVGKYLRNKK